MFPCGYLVIYPLLDFIVSFPSADAGTLVFELIASLVFASSYLYRLALCWLLLDPSRLEDLPVVLPLLVILRPVRVGIALVCI